MEAKLLENNGVVLLLDAEETDWLIRLVGNSVPNQLDDLVGGPECGVDCYTRAKVDLTSLKKGCGGLLFNTLYEECQKRGPRTKT